MDRKRAAREIERLARLVAKYDHEYHVLGRPTVSDAEYDRLFGELSALELDFPDLRLPDSPTLRVGSDLSSELPEVAHTIPVLSLDKAYSRETVSNWMERIIASAGSELSFVVEEKIDGISIVLYYEHGLLVRAVTRGNGSVGNDVTANVRTIGSVPLSVREPLDVAVRGEIYLPVARFAGINDRLEVPYANPRNLAAGAVRRIKSSEVAAIPLTMFAYEIYGQDRGVNRAAAENRLEGSERLSALGLASHLDALALLERLGFRRNPRLGFFSSHGSAEVDLAGMSVGTFADLPDYLGRAARERRSLDYEIDGVVVKVDELAVRERMGYTGHHPRWAVAFKFESPEGITTVESIDVQVGRTGRITPVARVHPVQVGGTTISNVTLHNQEYVGVLELAVGDTVVVSRRGDVIPAVERVIEKNEQENTTWKMPDLCPSCESSLELIGAHHFCPNRGCPAQVRGRLRFFAARAQMDIDSLGPETIELLVERGVVTDLPDLYRFDPGAQVGLPGFGPKKAELLASGIEASRNRPFSVVLPSLGIPELGPKVTELLIGSGITSIDELFAIADSQAVERLSAIDGIGEKTAKRIVDELSNVENRNRIEALRGLGLKFSVTPSEAPPKQGHSFAGQIWCVTGSFERFKPRDLATEEVKRRGGSVTSSVSSRTTHLLAGEGAGSKLAKARELGIIVVTEAEFVDLLARVP